MCKLHLKRMTYETRLLRLAGGFEGFSGNLVLLSRHPHMFIFSFFRQILESFRLTQGSGLRAGLLVGLRRAGQLIVEFWPSRRLFWAVWRFPHSAQRSGLVRHRPRAGVSSSCRIQRFVSVSFGSTCWMHSRLPSALVLSIGCGSSLHVACCTLEQSHAMPCFFGGWRRSVPHSRRWAGQAPANNGMVRTAFYMSPARVSPSRRGQTHRVIGTGIQISCSHCQKRGPSGESS